MRAKAVLALWSVAYAAKFPDRLYVASAHCGDALVDFPASLSLRVGRPSKVDKQLMISAGVYRFFRRCARSPREVRGNLTILDTPSRCSRQLMHRYEAFARSCNSGNNFVSPSRSLQHAARCGCSARCLECGIAC